MFNTTTFIRRHFALLPKGVLVTTRALLCHGHRSAVDKCLSRMVKEGRIIRVARGVFIRAYGELTVKLPSIYEVAQAKARAFGKEIYTNGEDAARHFGFSNDVISNTFNNMVKNCSQTIFAIAGQTTSFKYGDIKIILKGISPKYLKLGDSIPGLVIRGLLHSGIRKECIEFIHHGPVFLRSELIDAIRAAAGQMPWWLSDQFYHPWWYRDALVKTRKAAHAYQECMNR